MVQEFVFVYIANIKTPACVLFVQPQRYKSALFNIEMYTFKARTNKGEYLIVRLQYTYIHYVRVLGMFEFVR